ncbi:MAG: DUF2971 domain-containing protein [Flavobacterium sp.]|uniref:DUF2971 domain-containing protein n=1 Tax=Flavobacterium sp. TaxID=239 RepID=UPI003262DC04
MTRIPRKLYHYCSVESFFQIISSKSIWLSNYGQMNDAHESIWIEQYFDIVNNLFKSGKYKDFQNYTIPTYGWNKGNPHLFCLSEVGDSLGQWRAYADDGKGIAICFTPTILNFQFDKPNRSSYIDHTLGLVKIEYNAKKQKAKVEDLANLFKNIYDGKKDELWEAASSFLGISLATESLVIKNPSFIEEKEWRIIHTPSDNYDLSEKNSHSISQMKFRTKDSNLTSYFEIDLSATFNSKLIPEIILGPKSGLDLSILKSFLEINNLEKTIVSKSASTYQ